MMGRPKNRDCGEDSMELHRNRRGTMKAVVGLALLTLGTSAACSDKAEDGFRRCEQLERDGKLEEAAAECGRASQASPNSPFGKLAQSKKTDLLDQLLPANVTREWCARLRARLEKRLESEAGSKYPGRDPDYIRTVVRDYALNVEYNCSLDVGKPIEGVWKCRWNEHSDNSKKECDDLEKQQKGDKVATDHKSRMEVAMAPCSLPATAMAQPDAVAACQKNFENGIQKGSDQSSCVIACDGGDAPSCLALGRLFQEGDDGPQKHCGFAPLRKACDAGIGDACEWLGDAYMDIANSVGKNHDEALKTRVEFRAKGCDLGAGPACEALATDYDNGYGVAQDKAKSELFTKKALPLLERECAGKDASSCFTAGSLYEKGERGIMPNRQKSMSLYKQACALGDQFVCNKLKSPD